jgi:hypothetical protein
MKLKIVLGILVCLCLVRFAEGQEIFEKKTDNGIEYVKEFYCKDVVMEANRSDVLMFDFFVYFTSRGFNSTMHINGIDVYGNRTDGRMNYKAVMDYMDKVLSVRFEYTARDLVSDPSMRIQKDEIPKRVKEEIDGFYEGALKIVKSYEL